MSYRCRACRLPWWSTLEQRRCPFCHSWCISFLGWNRPINVAHKDAA